jgi:hypothetical protein
MPAIATTDVAYTTVDQVVSAPGRVRRRVKVTFPATNLLYQTGGVPLLGPNLAGTARGIVAAVKVVAITVSATASMNPLWQWDGSTTAPKLVALAESGAATANTAFDQWPNNTSITSNSQVLTLEVEPG